MKRILSKINKSMKVSEMTNENEKANIRNVSNENININS